MCRFLSSPAAAVLALGILTGVFVLSGVLGCERVPERSSAPAAQSPPAEPVAAPARAIEPPAPAAEPAPIPAVESAPMVVAPPVVEPAEEPIVTPEPAPEARRAVDLRVVEAALGRGVEARTPQAVGTLFAAGGQSVWAWVKVRNRGDEEHIWMIWAKDGDVRSRVKLRVGTSPGWRTWSRHRMRSTRDVGEWTVDVETESGEVLHTLRFEVEAPGVPLAGDPIHGVGVPE